MSLAKSCEFRVLFRAIHVERVNLFQLVLGTISRNAIRFDSVKEFLGQHFFFLENQKIINILRSIDIKCEGEIIERVWDNFFKVLSSHSKTEIISSNAFDHCL